MKKILISFISLFIILFINIQDVYAVSLLGVTNSQYLYIITESSDYNNSDFILNDSSNFVVIFDKYNKNIYTGTFYRKASYTDGKYYYSYKLSNNFYYKDTDESRNYDIYISDSNLEYKYYLSVDDCQSYIQNFSDFEEYKKDVVVPDNPDNPDNPDVNVSIDYDFNIIHNDLLILIVLTGFYIFTKIIIVICRNFSGGD